SIRKAISTSRKSTLAIDSRSSSSRGWGQCRRRSRSYSKLLRVIMKHAFLVGVVAILAGSSLAGQGQGRGDQPPDFQTRMPWASWEGGYNSGWSSVPQAQQVSEPFKMFDNMYYVGLQNNSS